MSAEERLRELAEAAVARALGASAEAREALEAILRLGRPSRTREGKAFFYQGDRAEAAYLLLDGRARLLQFKPGGKSIELPPLEGGDWLGLGEMLLGAPHPCDALAETECLAIAFPRYSLTLARARPAFAALVASELAREKLDLHAFISDESPEERIVSYLLSRRGRLAGSDGAKVPITQERLAMAIGVTRETVNKRLADLESRGLLRALRGQIEVLDWDALAALREL